VVPHRAQKSLRRTWSALGAGLQRLEALGQPRLAAAAVFLCSVEVLAALSTRLCTTRSNLAAVSPSPPSAAATAFLVKVRIVVLRPLLASRRFSDCLWYFIADALRAIVTYSLVGGGAARSAAVPRDGTPGSSRT
jgi:hypothetical protein